MASTKKGHPIGNNIKDVGFAAAINFGANWGYNWSHNFGTGLTTAQNKLIYDAYKRNGIEWCPMEWSKSWIYDNLATDVLSYTGGVAPRFWFSFNEPDLSSQANLSVADVLKYHALLAPKVPAASMLVGPAMSDGAWTFLANVYDGLKSAGTRFDAMAIHNYRTDLWEWPQSTTNGIPFFADKYGVPIVVTEFGYVNWNDTLVNGWSNREWLQVLTKALKFAQWCENSEDVVGWCPYFSGQNFRDNSWFAFSNRSGTRMNQLYRELAAI